MPSSPFLLFAGGLALFFFGLHAIQNSLMGFAGDRLKSMVARTTASKLRSCLTGLVVTFFLQSSSALTSMTVGMAATRLITLDQAMAIGLGAGIGSTLVVLLLASKGIVSWGLSLIIIGLLFRSISRRKVFQVMGEIGLSFGFLFYGLTLMSQATAPLKDSSLLPTVLQFFESYPFALFVIAAGVTAVVYSSSVMLGIIISLAHADTMTLSHAIPIVLGCNIGTAFAAMVVAWNAKVEGKRVAWANFLLRLGTVLILGPFLGEFTYLVQDMYLRVFVGWFGQILSVAGEIAFSHFLFNFLVVLIFLPLIPFGKKIVCWLIPSQNGEEVTFGPKYLDPNALATPTLAFAQVQREVLRMAEIVQGMLQDSFGLFEKYDLDTADRIREDDHKVDLLYKSIKFYLARMSFQNMPDADVAQGMHFVTAINELETMGDMIDRHLLRLARKRWVMAVTFSETGWQELSEMHRSTLEMLQLSIACMATSNMEIARKMKLHQDHYAERADQMRISHLKRLSQELKASVETSAIHLELISLFTQMNSSLMTMVHYLLADPTKKPVGSLATVSLE